ncbi:MAG: hypothetical protein Q8P53_04595 [Candidatus Shapirobacteria bacterium]|nr:hypothetical protein [Candidatus Shapirobacteria bacterium]
MSQTSFWLVSIEDTHVSVTLVSHFNKSFSVMATGPQISWSAETEDSLNMAIDESLSSAASQAQISEDQEPTKAAFILPPFWVGSDNKIVAGKLKLIENLCRSLKLKPTGFIANDEAIAEETNLKDGFPASFILLNLGKSEFTLSLVYLGKVKERIRKAFTDNFNPTQVESTLLEINSESTLPPQIIVFGQTDDSIISSLKNYSWIGKKNVETFLHFPDIKQYLTEELINIYTRIISVQIPQEEPQPTEIEPVVEVENEESSLDEVSSEDLGFSEDMPLPTFIQTPAEFEPEPEVENIIPVIIPKNDFIKKINLKNKFRLPRFKIHFAFKSKFKPPVISLIAISPLLILIPFYFSSAKITLFVTPYVISKKIPIILDSTVESFNSNKGIVPVKKQTFSINTTASVETTGKKTVGDKAKGEIVVFNKQDKSQTIPKGTVLVDSSGKKFQLINSAVIASSSSDFEKGVINLGQTKTVVEAMDIGPEYNLNKDTKLIFKDISENLLVGKIADSFSGGSKRQINAVSASDKTTLEQKINQATKDAVSEKISKDVSGLIGAISESVQSKQSHIEYSREIDEEADELSATSEASVIVFVLDPEEKSQIIDNFLSSEETYRQSQHSSNGIDMKFKLDKIDEDKAIGTLDLEGQLIPNIDISQIRKRITGKTQSSAISYLKKGIDRVYNYHIDFNFKLFGSLTPMPFRSQNIVIDIKTESL